MASEPNAMDVICGRGNKVNHHPGNKVFRRLIEARTELYRSLDSTQRPLLVKSIVLAIRSRGSEFMIKDKKTGQWIPASNDDAMTKTKHAFRRSVTNNPSSRSAQAIASHQTAATTTSSLPIPNAAKAPPVHGVLFNNQEMMAMSSGYLGSDEATANTSQAQAAERLEGLSDVVNHRLRACAQPTSQSNTEPEYDRKVSPSLKRTATAVAAPAASQKAQVPAFQHDMGHLRISGPLHENVNQHHHAENEALGTSIPSRQTHVARELNLDRLENGMILDANEIRGQQQQLLLLQEQQQNQMVRSQEAFSTAMIRGSTENETADMLARESETKENSDGTSDSGLPRMQGDGCVFFNIDQVFDSDENMRFDSD